MANKIIDDYFRERAGKYKGSFTDAFDAQTELIKRLFDHHFEEYEKKWDARLKAEFEDKLEPIVDRAEPKTNA